MRKIKPRTLKGFRDFLPSEAKKRQWLINTLISVFESYGFEPLETPALEYEEILLGKYGDEGDKLMYRFKDRGGRKVALRYDQTVPLARVVAQYQNDLPIPFKRYQIQNVWRAENTQKGRYREFLQVDADIVGSESALSDLEILSCVNTSLKNLGFKDFTILVNDRRIFERLKISLEVIRVLDKEDKIGTDKMFKEMTEIIGSDEEAKISYEKIINVRSKDYPESFQEILERSEDLNLFLMPSSKLARGLDYYTGLIFEVRIPKYKGGSVCGGGRYDRLIGMFTGKDIPAVGFSFGFDRLIEAMEELKLFPDEISESKVNVLVTIFNNDLKEKSLGVYSFLRNANVNCEIYLDENTPLEKQLKYADKKGIPYTIIIGPEEIKNNAVTLKNMKTGEQKRIVIEKIKEATTI